MDSFYEQHLYTITENYKNSVRIKSTKGKVHIKNKANVKQYFQKSSNHHPLAPLKDIIEKNHNIRNDFITLFVEQYNTNNTDETMSTQSDKTIPYMLDSERDYDDDLSAGTNSVDQQRSHTTKSGRVTKIPEHLKNLYKKINVNIQTEARQCHILLMLKKGP